MVCSSQSVRYSVIQHLAMGIFMGRWKEASLAMITAYFDASGSPDTAVISVGAVVSTAEKWMEFTRQWEEILEAFEVPSLHMKHFAHSLKEYAGWKDDEFRRRRFLKALLRVMEDHVDFTAAASVTVRDYNLIDSQRSLSEFMRPYTFALSTAVSAIGQWGHKNNLNPETFLYLVEKGDNDQDDVNRCWRREFPNMRISPVFLEKCDLPPGEDIWRPIRQFEACDFIAYENHKANIKVDAYMDAMGARLPLDKLRAPAQEMFDRLPGSKEWLTAGVPELNRLCAHFQIPTR